jgi:hypothetical protein
MSDAKEKRKKDSFVVRMRRRGREIKNLGQILANEPGRFPSALLNVFRRAFRTVWDARGGGLYACGYVLTFVWLELKMFVDDILSAESISGYFGEQIFEIFFRYLGESLRNMISAFMWPVQVIEISPPWGIGILVGMFVVFARWIKEPLANWLFHEDELPPLQESNE